MKARKLWTAGIAFVSICTLAVVAFAQHDKPAAKADAGGKRSGDPYYLATCPISGGKLGSMGDPVVKVYDGREVRFCCGDCPGKFEKDMAGSMAKLDQKIMDEQRPIYPMKTSVVSGKDLPEKPVEFVYGNRLVRVADAAEKEAFMKDTKSFMDKLDKAAIAEQGKKYPLDTCVVSGEKFSGEMGEPKEVVLAGRLIKLCCNQCKKDLEKSPATFLAKVDAAQKGGKP
ncbi:MAG: hypothetical protein HY287_11730 [Planctomycetes bacterium]|nr:hypothetical protein [Planctomycetota bacterium]